MGGHKESVASIHGSLNCKAQQWRWNFHLSPTHSSLPSLEPLPEPPLLTNAVLFGEPQWDALPQRQALVNKGATGNLFAEILGRRNLRAKSQRERARKVEKLCVCARTHTHAPLEASSWRQTGLDHMLPGWSVRTQRRGRWPHVVLGRKVGR